MSISNSGSSGGANRTQPKAKPGVSARRGGTAAPGGGRNNRFLGSMKPEHADTPDRARQLMHGIFVGEIQVLEGAGRSAATRADSARASRTAWPSTLLW